MGSTPSKPFDDPELQGETMVKEVKRNQDIVLSWETNSGVYGQWRKGSQLLKENDRISITQSNDYKHFTLTIKDAREEDEGTYSLELWNYRNYRNTVTGCIEVKLLEYDEEWRTVHWEENEKMKKFLKEFKPSNSEVSHLHFLLCGPVGAGKTSIINSINCTFQGCITDLATAGQSHTKDNKTYNVLDEDTKELRFVFTEVKDVKEFSAESLSSDEDLQHNSSPCLNDEVHCLVNVVPADKIALLDDTDTIIVKMKKIRQVASDLGIPQVVFLTHVDTCPVVKEDLTHIYLSKMIEHSMQHCSNKLGVPMSCIFPVKNYDKESIVNDQTDSLILDALQTIVHYANDYVYKT